MHAGPCSRVQAGGDMAAAVPERCWLRGVGSLQQHSGQAHGTVEHGTVELSLTWPAGPPHCFRTQHDGGIQDTAAVDHTTLDKLSTSLFVDIYSYLWRYQMCLCVCFFPLKFIRVLLV